MNILAIETSTHACSAALITGSSESYEVVEEYSLAPRQHTTLIFEQMESVLAKKSLSLDALDGLAFGRGPGAFTGVRIATGVIQGIAYASDLPVAPVSSLAATAQGIYRQHGVTNILVANDARMDEIYFSAYQIKDGVAQPVMDEQVLAPQELSLTLDGKWFAAGSGWQVYEEDLSAHANLIQGQDNEFLAHAQDIAVLGLQMAEKGQWGPAIEAQPVYLRDNVAKKKSERT